MPVRNARPTVRHTELRAHAYTAHGSTSLPDSEPPRAGGEVTRFVDSECIGLGPSDAEQLGARLGAPPAYM